MKEDTAGRELLPPDQTSGSQVFELRGYFIMLAARVAEVFGVETREIVQNITRNNDDPRPLFPERYAFQVNKQELEQLRSLGVISKPGRGGSRALPWVVTRKGAIRLATIMKTPAAMDAADVFVDVFDEVLLQVTQGQNRIHLSNPSRIALDEEHINQYRKLRKKITKAVDDLLNTVVDSELKITVKDELSDVAQEAVNHIKEWLRSRKVGNEKIEAETCFLLEQVRDMYERRQSDLATAAVDREQKLLVNFEKKIAIVEKLLEMYDKLEPNAVINLVGQYIERPMLPESKNKRLPNKGI
ncbi:MAG: ORF6N domain-containing protein [Candidatus Aegiribacteria sp.]|nr:ORF6N domain-containing protein [Candidatus Aegiribacteria sp.]